jgi:hypothetical protein
VSRLPKDADADFNMLLNALVVASTKKTIGRRDTTLKEDLLHRRVEKQKSLERGEEDKAEGIFSWAILLGYAIFGEPFVVAARNMGINLHIGTISAFCDEFKVDAQLRSTYLQTAKANGKKLGFLVKNPQTEKTSSQSQAQAQVQSQPQSQSD